MKAMKGKRVSENEGIHENSLLLDQICLNPI